MERVGKLILLFVVVFSLSVKDANANVLNWCGEYFEKNDAGYIRLLRGDAGIGSRKCTMTSYKNRREDEKLIDVRLNFSRSRLSYAKWRKFVGHVVEVRGKYKNGQIERAKLVRDLGR